MPKVVLRKYKMSDLDRICELFLDDRVLKNLAVPMKAKDISKKDEKEWLKKNIKSYKQKKPEGFNLAITVNGTYIGGIGAHHIDYANNKTQVGYWIGYSYWGKGYVAEALRQFVKILFRKFKFKRIEAAPYGHNKASQRVLEKAGFKFEKITHKTAKKQGKLFDEKFYALIK